MKTKLAVFDIDGTIFRSSLVIELVNTLVEKQIFPKFAKEEIEKDYIAWVDRRGSYDNYINKVVEVFMKYVKGASEIKVRKATTELINEQKDRTYVFTRNLIKKLKKEGYFLYAISGSPQVLVEEFAKGVGFDDFRGSDYEIANGKYTGRLLAEVFLNKSGILNEFLNEHEEFSLREAIGVGDSEGDISFLEMVGKPIAFNPAKSLAEYAKSKNWKIVVERKNVVYEIKDFEFSEIES